MNNETWASIIKMAIRGLILVLILRFTASDFDATEMVAILLYLTGSLGVVGIERFFDRTIKKGGKNRP